MFKTWEMQRLAMLPQLLLRRIRNADNLERLCGLASAKLVTFDVFDTALLRSVAQPLDALALAAWRAEKRYSFGIGMKPLLQARIAAEREARRLAAANGRQEVTLDEIYDHLPDSFVTVRGSLQAEELATERDICRANPTILTAYRRLIASGVPVAFISDTSLPQDFVAQLLEDSGYGGPHRVFASSAFGKTKSKGALFKVVSAETGIAPADICHIGDNAQSDVVQAQRAGINGFWFRPTLRRPLHQHPEKYARDDRSLARSLMVGIPHSLQAEENSSAQPWRRIGLSVAGPLHLGFTQWLMDRVTLVAPERIYFCSRDGQIVKRIYERLCRAFPHAPKPEYLLVSRRALVIPGFKRIGARESDYLVGGDNLLWLPVEEYLRRIRLDPESCRAAMVEHGLPPGTLIDGEPKRARLRSLLETLEPEILTIARHERELLVGYLRQEGCFETDKFVMCDIGWRGSLQRSLIPILAAHRPAVRVCGYYLGTYGPKNEADFGGPSQGWLIDNDAPEHRRRILQSGITVVELLFTASHGTVLNYRDEGGTVVANLAPLGISSEYASAAGTIQDAALVFAERYVKAFGNLPPLSLHAEDVFSLLARLIDCPSVAEAKAIGDLVLVDGLGTTQFGQPIASPPSLWQLLTKPSTLMAKFRQSPWRLGLLVRLIGSPKIAFAAMTLRRRLELRSKTA
jgi:FMN phosphatase YigB (HAD superfamily)